MYYYLYEDFRFIELLCTADYDFSYNRHEERKNRLVLSVFAREIEFVDETPESSKTNQIYLKSLTISPMITTWLFSITLSVIFVLPSYCLRIFSEERKNRLVLSVFAREIEFVDETPESSKTNQIYLDGFICKEPIYRKTPLGREIADLLLAVNRPYQTRSPE